jgi:3-hydroxybutyrate dehydrogenase
LIYQSKIYEDHSKDYELGLNAMHAHWQSGLDDIRRTLADPRSLDPRVPCSASSRVLSIAQIELKRISSLTTSKGMPMKGKVAIVTGSTSGIGLGIANELARLGADLVLNGFGDAGEIETIRAGIEREHNVRVVYDGADMSEGDAVRGLITAAIRKFGRLDILVNNAGIQFTAPVEEFPPAKWNAILDINLSAAFHGIAAAVPQMKKQRWGRIVNIASAHGLVASTHKAAYVAAKHGLIGLTKVVGLETAGSGITCNAVCPGWVRTPLVERQISDAATRRGVSETEAARQLLAEKQPSLDFVTTAQLGGTIAFLCSAAADQITGTAISVDGGWTAQ